MLRGWGVHVAVMVTLLATVLWSSATANIVPQPPAPLWPDHRPLRIDASIDPAHAAEDLDALRARIAERIQRLQAGLSIAVIEDGRTVWTEGFGTADIDAGRRTTPDTVYRVGSFSKTIVALMMAQLEHEGRLDLHAPLSEVAPEIAFEDRFADEDPVRVTHLMEHATGFDEMRFNEMFAEPDELQWSMARVLELNPRSRRVRWRPGTRHSYCHPGYTIAGHLIEKLTGQSFDAAVRRRLFAPLGIEVGTFVPTEASEALLAVGYDRELQPLPVWYLHHRPGSHLYVSAREFARVVELLVGRGVVDGRRVLDESVIERIETGGTLPYEGLSPWYGLGVYSTQWNGATVSMHGGWMPGFDSVFRYAPELGTGFVVLSNEPNKREVMRGIVRELDAYMLRRAEPKPPPPPVELGASRLAELAGVYDRGYVSVEFRRAFELEPPARVFVSGADLVLDVPDEEPMALIPVDEQRFRLPEQTRPSVQFTTDAEGNPVMWNANDFAYYERASEWWTSVRQWLRINVPIVLGYALYWPPLWLAVALFRRRRPAGLCVWPCVGALAVHLFASTLLELEADIPQLAHVTARTVTVFLSSCAIPIATACSVVCLLRRSTAGPLMRAVSAVFTCALVLVTVHLGWCGVLGVRTWLW